MAGENPARSVTDRLPAGTRVLVITVSDGVAAGARDDASGAAVAARLAALGASVDRAVVADDLDVIAETVRAGARTHPLVVLTGGTGLTPRDVTPQAVRSTLAYEIPGIGEAMRAAGRAVTPLADLSRGLGGVAGRALVISLPGSPRGALESLGAVEPILAHALETLAGPFDHGRGGASAESAGGGVAYDRPVTEDAD
ncbi:MAG TPA: MogA/MoaB family molybdenum cofactor biosynthesis protein [Candidatus Sulfomarinibacteraceae bacterium]|nr:MogA/MoaB family molybdenum cofactor biosynthesis protein [Candidatus Sulfomarinibacteraceae bacterium]